MPATPESPPLDVSGRAIALREVDLDRFFQPRTIVVIGPSTVPGKPNATMWQRLRDWGEAAGATVIPVHPDHAELDGRRCYASILDVDAELDDDIDLAVILVGDAVAMFATVATTSAAFAVVFSAGFAESGAEGAARQRELAEIVAAHETRLLGPNTNLNAFEEFRDLPGRSIALITQSGHQGRPVFQAQELGIRLSHWAPTGNEVDLEFADFVQYFADRADVGAIACYIEGFKDGRSLQLAADHAARAGTPIVCVKVGRTAEGASMAQSHTGHLTGADRVVDAVLRQFGVTRVDGLDELTDVAATFARTTRPSGDGVCVYSISGGTGAHMADLCAAAGLRLPELTPATQARLHDGLIPSYLRASNPVDSGGPPSMDERGPKVLEAILADPGVDVLICPITGAVDALSRPLATDLVDAARTTDKPIFVVWGSPDVADPVYTEILLPSGLPVFRTFGNCVLAVRAYLDWWAFQDRYRSPFDHAVSTRRSPAAARSRPLLEEAARASGTLSEQASKELLRAYGIRTSTDVLCRSAAEAGRAARALGLPVVMKSCAPNLAHKTELGLVRTGVSSLAEAKAAYAELTDAGAAAGLELEGVLVCETVTGGVECVVGASTDELFGPVVMFGLGGVFVEVLEEVTFRVPPFDRAEARRMVAEVRGTALLAGARGRPPADVTALVDAIMRVQRLAVEQADLLDELDINPLVVLPRGRGVVALDALAIPRT